MVKVAITALAPACGAVILAGFGYFFDRRSVVLHYAPFAITVVIVCTYSFYFGCLLDLLYLIESRNVVVWLLLLLVQEGRLLTWLL